MEITPNHLEADQRVIVTARHRYPRPGGGMEEGGGGRREGWVRKRGGRTSEKKKTWKFGKRRIARYWERREEVKGREGEERSAKKRKNCRKEEEGEENVL